jgi:subtilisin family serine protease
MKILMFLTALLVAVQVQSQVKMSAETKHILSVLHSLEGSVCDPKLFDPYPVYQLNNVWYLSVAGHLNADPDWSQLIAAGCIRGSEVGRIGTVKVPVETLSQINWSAVFEYVEVPAKVFPHLDKVIKDTRVDSVQQGIGLPMGFSGDNVIIGVADWGFDYTHPMFYDTLLQQSRVIAAWDQFRNAGDHPETFGYGVEFDTIDELMNAGSDTSNIYSYNTHGTHVAGIAGGGGAGIDYRGMAPAAGFLFNTFLIDYASVIDGFVWMKEKAESMNKRLVINMSWGLFYIGTMDGNSLISEAISELSDQGVIFVSSAGNNGDANFHIKKVFDQDEIQTRIIFDSYQNTPNMWGQSVTAWGEPGEPFNIRLSIYATVNTILDVTPDFSTATMEAYVDSFLVSGNDTVWYNITCDAAHPLNGRPHMRIRVRNLDSTIKVALHASAESGTVHFWNVVELTTGVGNWGLNFMAVGANGVGGDPDYGISEPACADDVIAVAAYASGYINSQGNPAGGTIADFTSFGPLITEQIKPDIAAPGVSVASSISSFTDAAYNAVNSTEFNGTTYDFARFSGTSMASPCVAGIVALMLDANPFLTRQQVEDILKETARLDEHTGMITAPGDVRWGMGKVNAYAAVLLSLATTGLYVEEPQAFTAFIYPNPAGNLIHVGWNDGEFPEQIAVFDMNGKKSLLALTNGLADVSFLAPGQYVIELKGEDRIGYTRLVIHQ